MNTRYLQSGIQCFGSFLRMSSLPASKAFLSASAAETAMRVAGSPVALEPWI